MAEPLRGEAVDRSESEPAGAGPTAPPAAQVEGLDRFLLELAPEVAAGVIAAASAHSAALGIENAVSRQQSDSTIAAAVLAQTCIRLLGAPGVDEVAGPRPEPAAPVEPDAGRSRADGDSAGPTAAPESVVPSGSNGASERGAQAAILVQDAVDDLRRTSVIANCAAGVAFARFLETGNPGWLAGVDAATKLVATSVTACAEKMMLTSGLR